ncbi:MAG: aromatic-ring-hydroxylating dioxygenase subunit beta [Rhodospirillaceae bacterium]|nr:aromatic-ring-hydroxylating dioxygenase subunit beta [Rhodospirillaceae bacterium]MDD9927631.1 aromatic-ring-hydroxylating dioxygenase subunit beta [Rhodospirillaceae bacterium]
MASIELRLEIEDLYTAYAATLDDDNLDAWPDLFTEDCLYQVIPRDNFDRDLPLALIRCESRAMLRDRVTAVRETTMFEPRYVRHLISNIRVSPEADGVIEAQANYAVFETMTDAYTRVFNVGRYLDKLVREDGRLLFSEKRCVYDSVLVPNSIIYPI